MGRYILGARLQPCAEHFGDKHVLRPIVRQVMGGSRNIQEVQKMTSPFLDSLTPDQTTMHDALCDSARLAGYREGVNAEVKSFYSGKPRPVYEGGHLAGFKKARQRIAQSNKEPNPLEQPTTLAALKARYYADRRSMIEAQAAAGLTQTQAARKLGVGRTALNNIIKRTGIYWPYSKQGVRT